MVDGWEGESRWVKYLEDQLLSSLLSLRTRKDHALQSFSSTTVSEESKRSCSTFAMPTSKERRRDVNRNLVRASPILSKRPYSFNESNGPGPLWGMTE